MSYQEFQARENLEARSVTYQPRGRLRVRATARKRVVYPNQMHIRNKPYCELCEGVGHWTQNCWRTSLRRMLAPENAECDWCGMRGHFSYRCPNPGHMRHWSPCDSCGEPGHLNNHCWRARPDRPIFPEPTRCIECGGSGHFSNRCPYWVVREM
ncbi:PREDICTED: ATP-dependent RNA helicase glh-4-like [Camelina sativa]|uniref:ATP-dependent RNA helicase glh-4-like n=1 Tax=Camelina sativa TaxID=90675 RepID=A0ABM1RS54_CAMSA|nr:PREDICTED: ATP-dependent RNA helicase glh-4-like [Camelina sativa]